MEDKTNRQSGGGFSRRRGNAELKGKEKMEIEYKHLWAWDTMMGSHLSWKESMQAKAKQDDAPKDAVYRKEDGSWLTFGEVESEITRSRVAAIVADMER